MANFYKVISRSFSNTPQAYGWFHLSWLAFFIILTGVFCYKFKNKNDKQVKLFILICLGILVAFEIIKQLSALGEVDKDNGHFKYKWSYFPLFFCSIPYFLFPIYLINWNKNLNKILINFVSFTSLYGGISIMIFIPNEVLNKSIFFDCHSMIHHGILMLIGIVLIFNNYSKFDKGNYIIHNLVMFLIMFSVVIILNEIFYQAAHKDLNKLQENYPNLLTISHRLNNHLALLFEKIFSVKLNGNYWVITLLYPVINFALALSVYGLIIVIKVIYTIFIKVSNKMPEDKNKIPFQ